MEFGALGNGKHDDTAAFQAAFDAMGVLPGQVYVPTGSFLLTQTIRVISPGLFSLRGDGPSSNILWSADKTLLLFCAPSPVSMTTITDFTVSSIDQKKSATSTALAFPAGFVKSQIRSVQLIGAGGLPGGAIASTLPIGSGQQVDNVRLDLAQSWKVKYERLG